MDQANITAAQQYIYETDKTSFVLLGSSLTTVLKDTPLKNLFYNLSFNAGSALTGLEIISRSDKTPHIIFIETNMIINLKNHAFINRLFSPFIWKLRGFFPILQGQYQPVNVFLSAIKNRFGASKIKKKTLKTDSAVFKKILALKKEQFSIRPTISLVKPTMVELKRLITLLERRGSKIVFFEMPVHAELAASKRALFIQKIFRQYFPKKDYPWITIADHNAYQTIDGIHLNYSSYIKFADFFIKRASSFFPFPAPLNQLQ